MEPTPVVERRFRVWPAVAALILTLLGNLVPVVAPQYSMTGLLIVALCAVFIVLWWLLFSRAPWLERIVVVAVAALAIVALRAIVHPSIAGGAQGYLAYLLGFFLFAFAVAIWAVAFARANRHTRRVALVPALLLLGCAPLLAIRTEGVKGSSGFMLHWRWTPTPEDLLLARGEEELKPVVPTAAERANPAAAATATTPPPASATTPAAPVAAPEPPPVPAEWPGFRGPRRDGVVHNVQIATDWTQSPPAQLWKRAVGPGWSSFSVRGDLLYTQEQRGEEELVSCYRVSNGEPVWRHRDRIRFYESNGGPGPRGTPTIYATRVFAMGATGRLNALDAISGKTLWFRDTLPDAKRALPMWGISSSPLVVGDAVIVSAYGTLTAYDLVTGNLRWVGPSHGGSYSSPHLATFDGVEQVVILSSPGIVSVSPGDGKLLWEHKWEGGAIIQPALTDDGDILVNAMSAMGGIGTRRLSVKRGPGGWKVEEKWTTNGLKPYFNDFVVHKGHAYGFDNNILSCIDLSDGSRKWKGGRYGNGQMLLLADEDLLLVLSEDGDLALVKATPDQFTEIAKLPGVLDGKTWNHPVVVRDVLLVRNDHEMAAFRLPRAAQTN